MAEIQLQLDLTDIDDVMSILHRQADLLKQCRDSIISFDEYDDFQALYQTLDDLNDYFEEYK